MNRKLRASTLAEMLVVILLAGVALTAVMDGLGLFARHAARLSGRIVENGRFRESCLTLDEMIASADSVTQTEGRITAWRGGAARGVLYRRDSALLLSGSTADRRADTLFTSVVGFGAVKNMFDTPGATVDSISLTLLHRGELVDISLSVVTPAHIARQKEITRTEEKYVFE